MLLCLLLLEIIFKKLEIISLQTFINIPTNALISSIKLVLKLLRHVSMFLHILQVVS
jgi:hypothetical protein